MKDTAVREWLSRPDGIVERLRSMRSRAGLRGRDIAEPLGWVTSKVAKIEAANQLPTESDVRGWAGICGFPSEADELIEMLGEVPSLRVEWRRRTTIGDAQQQAEHDRKARDATVTRHLSTAVVPGLLQISDYARAVMTAAYEFSGYDKGTLDDAIAERLRRQSLLYEAVKLQKRLEFLLAEPVLYWRIASPTVMRAQLDRLMTAMGIENVRLGIVPFAAPNTAPVNSFVMYDELVVVETYVDEVQYPVNAADLHLGILDRLWATAAEGDDARRLIIAAAEALP